MILWTVICITFRDGCNVCGLDAYRHKGISIESSSSFTRCVWSVAGWSCILSMRWSRISEATWCGVLSLFVLLLNMVSHEVECRKHFHSCKDVIQHHVDAIHHQGMWWNIMSRRDLHVAWILSKQFEVFVHIAHKSQSPKFVQIRWCFWRTWTRAHQILTSLFAKLNSMLVMLTFHLCVHVDDIGWELHALSFLFGLSRLPSLLVGGYFLFRRLCGSGYKPFEYVLHASLVCLGICGGSLGFLSSLWELLQTSPGFARWYSAFCYRLQAMGDTL